MKQFYTLIRTFLILATFLIVKQASTQGILYLENFPNQANATYSSLPGGYSYDITGDLGLWHVVANTDRVVVAVDTPGFQTNYSLKIIDSANSTGTLAYAQINSAAGAIDLSGQAGNP
ncbi:MAG TPA: hypothetical protein VFQ58_02810, partial [Flavisolibacter sp.]|nr:hypothetical protein [Flavisolibacter sp.]